MLYISLFALLLAQGVPKTVSRPTMPVSDAEIARLAARLTDADAAVRLKAVEELAQHDLPTARQALMTARKDADRGVKLAALRALVRRRAPEFRPHLLDALYDGDEDLRLLTIPWAVQVKPRAVTVPLAGLLQDQASSERMRIAAARALGALHEETGVPALATALNATDLPAGVTEAVRIEAAKSLGILGGTFAIDELLTASARGSEALRREAVVALAPYAGLPRPGPRILAAAQKSDAETRRRFLMAARDSGKSSAAVFKAFAEDPDIAVRTAAAAGLRALQETRERPTSRPAK